MDALSLEVFLNQTIHTPPVKGVDFEVPLCEKSNVIQFGAAFLPAFYYTNFLLSLVGNGLVLYIIYKYEKLTTVNNIFLLNLVISDLIFAFSLPFWAVYHKSEWIFGSGLCKLVGSCYFIGFNSSILFLTLLTFDRYLAVVHAISAVQSRKKKHAFASSAIIWVLSILVPLVMVLYCYFRITIRIMSTRMVEKCRAVKLIFVIVFTFFICWTPYNVVILLKAIKMSFGDPNKCSKALDYALYITRNFAYLYCCISPVFYTFLGKKFQRHFLKLLAKRIPCLKINTLLSEPSSKTTSVRSPTMITDHSRDSF